jgi:DNA-binding NtrC family response regulator
MTCEDYEFFMGGRMKILVVDDDDSLRSWLAGELEARGCEVLQTHFGDGGPHLFKKSGPFELVLSDFRFIPGVKIKNGAQLVSAIHGLNPLQEMAIMTSDPQDARRNLPKTLRGLSILRKPFRIEQVLRLLRQPMLPLDCAGVIS